MREVRLRWYGHVTRRNVEHVGRSALNIDVPGTWLRGGREKKWEDIRTSDMDIVGDREEDSMKRN